MVTWVKSAHDLSWYNRHVPRRDKDHKHHLVYGNIRSYLLIYKNTLSVVATHDDMIIAFRIYVWPLDAAPIVCSWKPDASFIHRTASTIASSVMEGSPARSAMLLAIRINFVCVRLLHFYQSIAVAVSRFVYPKAPHTWLVPEMGLFLLSHCFHSDVFVSVSYCFSISDFCWSFCLVFFW